jgi:peptidoglycan/xylan/chitin deacetylase (PgdA/CDA1 family)
LNRRAWLASLASLSGLPTLSRPEYPDDRQRPLLDRGAIVRGPRDRRRLALVFTGDRYAEGSRVILDALRRHGIKAA